MVSWTVTRRPFHAVVALAISSPTFLGDCSTKTAHSTLHIGQYHRGRTHQTKRTDFRCQSRGGTDLTTGRPEVDDFDFVGVLNRTNSHIDEHGQEDDIARTIHTSLGAMVVGGFGGGA